MFLSLIKVQRIPIIYNLYFYSFCFPPTFQHLLRQGREAVLVSYEVDIASVEYSEDSPAMTGDIVRLVMLLLYNHPYTQSFSNVNQK